MAFFEVRIFIRCQLAFSDIHPSFRLFVGLCWKNAHGCGKLFWPVRELPSIAWIVVSTWCFIAFYHFPFSWYGILYQTKFPYERTLDPGAPYSWFRSFCFLYSLESFQCRHCECRERNIYFCICSPPKFWVSFFQFFFWLRKKTVHCTQIFRSFLSLYCFV